MSTDSPDNSSARAGVDVNGSEFEIAVGRPQHDRTGDEVELAAVARFDATIRAATHDPE